MGFKHTLSNADKNKILGVGGNVLKCSFCEKEFSSGIRAKSSKSFHERYCKYNVNSNKGHKTNQYIKAKELGSPKPILSRSARDKISKANKEKPRAYFSKESQEVIEKLLFRLTEKGFIDCDIRYGSRNRELFLKDLVENKCYSYDLCLNEHKVIIEYQGIAYHPKTPDDKNFRLFFKDMNSVESLYQKDLLKKKLAESYGYKIFYIWSDNVDADLESCIKEIMG